VSTRTRSTAKKTGRGLLVVGLVAGAAVISLPGAVASAAKTAPPVDAPGPAAAVKDIQHVDETAGKIRGELGQLQG
jgi:hypothetical protein